MPSTEESAREASARFGADLKQRFEEMVTWAIDNQPQAQRPLSRADFDTARQQIGQIAEGRSDIGERNAAVPEPSENGPQYVNVNPAPWP